jgi:hypothetical protein
MSVLQKLTEGIVERDLQKEGAALLNKWEATGLLEGIETDSKRNGMARLLENQAKQLLKEASSMAGGDVEGFAAVAFPIVRRVFGGLLANDLVSVQPMSLPSGLIFFLDFTHTTARLGTEAADSLYGGGVIGHQITGGANLTGEAAEDGFYSLNHGYSSPTASATIGNGADIEHAIFATGTFGGTGSVMPAGEVSAGADAQKAFDALCRFDADFEAGTTNVVFFKVALGHLPNLNTGSMVGLTRIGTGSTTDSTSGEISGSQVRRLTQYSGSNKGRYQAGDAKDFVLVAFASVDGTVSPNGLLGGGANASVGEHVANNSGGSNAHADFTYVYPVNDNLDNVGERALGAVIGNDPWGLEEPAPGTGNAGSTSDKNEIPEIDIKVDSVSVTAITKKLKAKWSPELGQDLNAYHNLDAEVELTGILSEQIALEIDREILGELIRVPRLVPTTGRAPLACSLTERLVLNLAPLRLLRTLPERLVSGMRLSLRRSTMSRPRFTARRFAAEPTSWLFPPRLRTFLSLLLASVAQVTHDDDRGTVGAVKVGALSKKWDVYVDPYFPRNLCLVGRNGGSFLETGFVYAPYVPLQVTPTIFGTEDFVPRKGVMTRYAKKMVRADMYGLVVVRGLLGEAGATS